MEEEEEIFEEKGEIDGNPFESSYLERMKEALESESLSGAANSLFGPLADKYSDSFSGLKDDLDKSDVNVLFRTYLSEVFFVPLIALSCSILFLIIFFFLVEIDFLLKAIITVFLPPVAALGAFIGLYMYPSIRISKREQDIQGNLPFALNHMSAVASSGIPPSSVFKLLIDFEEYGGIAKEANKIVRRIEVFGEDITTALREVARETPSDRFKEVLYGILSTIETGGKLKDFLDEQARSELFEYRMRREKEIENLSTYASFYTAILVAAPLFLVAVLAILNMMGGELFGLAIQDFMKLGIYGIIPALNAAFLLVLTIRQGSY